jgi:anaerobic magnesium-protoporphyrin IX monomethyl ester cyclase
MRIVLATRHAERAFIPLALLYLKASLAGRGHCAADEIEMAEFDASADAGAIADALLGARPDVVGLSCYVWNVTVLLAAVRLIRKRAPGVRIVLGGPEVGPVAVAVLQAHPYVDVVVHSEGEVPFADLVDAWQREVSPTAVAGIAFRDGDAIVDTGAAPLVKRLDDYPSPHLARYLDYTGRAVCIETQRGCVFHCNFCFYNKDYSLRNRRFDLDRVKEELLLVLSQDVDEIYLMDPVFNLNAARAKDICRFIADHNPKHVPVHSEIWAEFVDDEMAALMRAAGFRQLEVGLQTTDPTALATTERRLRVERFTEGIAHLRRHGLPFELQLIYGLPGETTASFRESLNFAIALDPPQLSVFRLMVLPGTELWRKAASLQLTYDPEPPYHVRSHLSMTRGRSRVRTAFHQGRQPAAALPHAAAARPRARRDLQRSRRGVARVAADATRGAAAARGDGRLRYARVRRAGDPAAVLRAVRRAGIRLRSGADAVRHTDDVGHGGHAVNADDVSAVEHAGRHRRGRTPLAG